MSRFWGGTLWKVRLPRRRIPTQEFLQNQIWLAYLTNIWFSQFSMHLYLAWKAYSERFPRKRRCGSTSFDPPSTIFMKTNLRRLNDGLPYTLYPPG